MNAKVVAIATTENVYLFRSLGFDVYLVDNGEKSKQIFEKVIDVAQIIIIDENLQAFINDYRLRFSEKAFPIIVALPIDNQSSGQGLEKLRSDVEKAVGIRLF